MPKLGEKKVLVSGICTWPPSLSALNSRSASAGLAALSASEKPWNVAFPWHWPSDAITEVSPIRKQECITFSPEPVVDYESFKANQDGELADLAWLYNMNRGIYMTPGREEEWTLSVAHSEDDCDAFVAAFDELAADLTA